MSNSNVLQQTTTNQLKLSEINGSDLLAIEMRFAGKKYIEIAQRFNVSKSAVDKWFEQKGRLAVAYEEYRVSELERRKRNGEELRKKSLEHLWAELIKLALNGVSESAKLGAIKEAFDREYGKSIQPTINANGTFNMEDYLHGLIDQLQPTAIPESTREQDSSPVSD